MHPGLLLLDEPTANLDPEGVKEVHDAVRDVLDRTHETLVVVEHHIDVWLDLVDRVIVLGKPESDSHVSGVIADGTPEEVFGSMAPVLTKGGAWVPGRTVESHIPESNQSSGNVVLRTEDLSFGREFALGEHVNLAFHAGEITALTGKNGVRRLPIKDFYIKAGTVDINVAEGEIQTAILIPKASWENTKGFYIKYGMRNAMEIATTGCSVNVRLSGDKKTFDRVRIAYGVAGPVPMRAPSAEAVVNGQPVTMENIEAFSRAVLEDINPRDSWRASKAFRKHIAVEMAKRALIESVKRCGGEI